jgi:circadian clock protein KaiC
MQNGSFMRNEPNAPEPVSSPPRYIATGVPGLDTILKGGFLRGGTYLVHGEAGTGKTTLGLQYLREQVKQGDRVLYVALTETRRDIEMICKIHGWPQEEILPFEPWAASLDPIEEAKTSIFDPADTEFGDLIKAIISEIERVGPSHLVLDGLAELRFLSGSSGRFRRQLICLKKFLEQRSITTLLFDDNSFKDTSDVHHAVVSGSIALEKKLPEYGRARRRIHIGKVRSSDFLEGFHDCEIRDTGLFVYPRLRVPEHALFSGQQRILSSGVENLDRMLKGGLLTGTASVFLGPSGVGKSSLAMQFVTNALKQGARAAVFTFDEVLTTFLARSERLCFAGEIGALKPYLEDGRLIARQIDPADLTPGAFAQAAIDVVDGGVSIVVIDSLNGYVNAMPEERLLTTHLHELVSYLNLRNVLTIMIVAQHGMIGHPMADFHVSYLSDSVLAMRYFELDGEYLRGLTVLKKRTGPHELRTRQFAITDTGIVVGDLMSRINKSASGALHGDIAVAEPRLSREEASEIRQNS